jgi:predicted PurR-regulated permease PerM
LQIRQSQDTDRSDVERANADNRGGQVTGAPRQDDAEPEPVAVALLGPLAQAATIGIFVLLFFVFLDQARPILLPLISAVVIGSMLGPVQGFLREHDMPPWASALLLTVLFLLLANLVIILMAAPLIDWIQRAPEIGNTIKDKLHILDSPLASLRELRKALMTQGGEQGLKVDTSGPADLFAPALAILTPAIGQLLLFIGALFFFLLSRDDMRRFLVVFFHDRDTRLRTLRILNDVERRLTSYLSIVAMIYLGMGCLTAVTTMLVGLPSPYVWGILAFVLNFVPYIGPGIMLVVLLGVGVVTFPNLTQAFIAPAVYLGLATMEGHFVTPSIIGQRLTLSPMMVFLALAFWAWIWGPVGAFLAVPLLLVGLVVLQHIRPKLESNLPG